jgi:excisionase family DNA binding protein
MKTFQAEGALLTIPERLRALRGGIDARMLAQLLGVSAVSVYKLAARHVVPSYRIGTSLRFDPVLVAQWLTGDN